MTPTQIARRSDALYADGTCGMTRRVLCDMVAQRESDLEDARAESAKLRSQCADLVDERERLFRANVEKNGEILRLAGENTKLRELVRDYDRCTMHADCSMCEYDGKLSTHCPFSPCFPDTDELRELGVEVDE